jgi:preprotein translocase subunit SecD
MKFCSLRFNIYLALALVLCLSLGCQTEARKRKNALATLQVRLETNPRPNTLSEQIKVGRDQPEIFTVEKAPFLTEKLIQNVKVIDTMGGFALSLQFDRQGSWLLEQVTAANRGYHVAVFSQFPVPPQQKLNDGRWLAAPIISNVITNGVLAFTPDMTRQEADQFALGLNHVAKMIASGQTFKEE